VLLIVADPEQPGHGIVALDKANATRGDISALRYRLESRAYTVQEIDTDTGEVTDRQAECAVAVWVGEVAGGREYARSLLTKSMERGDDPKAWLRRYLSGVGECESGQIKAAAGEAGYSEPTIKRAASDLKVRYRYAGRKTLWRLPVPDPEHNTDQPYYARTSELGEPYSSGESGFDLSDLTNRDKQEYGSPGSPSRVYTDSEIPHEPGTPTEVAS
jgi:hypothetical protein